MEEKREFDEGDLGLAGEWEVRKGGKKHSDKDMEVELAYGFQLLNEMFLHVDAAEGTHQQWIPSALGKACLLQAYNVATSGGRRALGGLVGESPKDVLGDSPGGTSAIITN